jgi:glycosyltransferase involved in cell wall biosynthesis
MFTASIIVPCYDEEATLRESVERLLEIADTELALEVIVVDDHSRDTSAKMAEDLGARHSSVKLVSHSRNLGKGAAIRTGFMHATGDVVAIHDADLEYDPGDLRKLIELIRTDKADVVFGSRFLSAGEHRVLYFWHSMGNRFLTFMSNMFTDLNLSDMEACYKVFRRKTIEGIEICENRFGFEPEIVAKVSERHPRIYEIGISYFGRTYEDGKKIGFKDGFRALYCILRYNAYRAPVPLQFAAWIPSAVLAIGSGTLVALGTESAGLEQGWSRLLGFVGFAAILEICSRSIIFLPASRWKGCSEYGLRALVLVLGGTFAHFILEAFSEGATTSWLIKVAALGAAALLQYAGARLAIYSARSGD